MSDILKLVSWIGIQYAEQTTILAEFCMEFYELKSQRSGISKDMDFIRQIYRTKLIPKHMRLIFL